MSKKIRILINTDSAKLHSGLSETCRNIFIPLLQTYPNDYEVHQIGWFHRHTDVEVPWPIYPTKVNQNPDGSLHMDDSDRYAQKSFPEIVSRVKPDIVFGYSDLWTFDHILVNPLRNTYRLCVYYTIDGQPYYGHINEDTTTAWGHMLAKADRLVVLSHFGEEVLHDSCMELQNKQIDVRYHPLNISKFPQYSEEQRREIRRTLLSPMLDEQDVFLCGWLGRNQFRKQNHKLWETAHYLIYGDYIECNDCGRITTKEWNHSARKTKNPKSNRYLDQLTLYDKGYEYDYCWHCKSSNIKSGEPDPNFYMWMHMAKAEPGYRWDLHERMWDVGHRLIWTNGTDGSVGISQEELISLITSWDMMYYPSGGEGFGNPAFECIAAGTPIVYSNYSSHAEFCAFGGLPVRVTYQPEMVHGIQRAVVDTNHAVEQILKLRRDEELRKQLGASGRAHAFSFSTQHMVGTWDKIFKEMMQKPLPIEGDKVYTMQV